jgi:hypothetical protein
MLVYQGHVLQVWARQSSRRIGWKEFRPMWLLHEGSQYLSNSHSNKGREGYRFGLRRWLTDSSMSSPYRRPGSHLLALHNPILFTTITCHFKVKRKKEKKEKAPTTSPLNFPISTSLSHSSTKQYLGSGRTPSSLCPLHPYIRRHPRHGSAHPLASNHPRTCSLTLCLHVHRVQDPLRRAARWEQSADLQRRIRSWDGIEIADYNGRKRRRSVGNQSRVEGLSS